MRIKIDIELLKPEIPVEYRRSILSFLKNSLSNIQDGKKLETYYKDTNQKDFTWSLFLPNACFNRDFIKLSDNNIQMTISTDDRMQTGFYLMMALINQKNKPYPLANGNSMVIRSVKQIQQKVIFKNECYFFTMAGTPIVVREHNKDINRDKYYTIEDDDFTEKMKTSIINQLICAGYEKNLLKDIEVKINDGDCKKVVIKHYGVYIDGTIGVFNIKAPAIILQHLYQNGLCSRRSAGFGMVDICN